MRELGRILSKRRLVLGLVLILLLNGLLFAREQREKDFGLDLTLPGGGFAFVNGEFLTTEEPVDARAAYRRYGSWLDRMRSVPPADAAELLEEAKTELSAAITGGTDTEDDRLDYVAVNNLLTQTDYLTGYGDWLASIQKNRENLLTFSIFNDPDSFSARSIIKTAYEFKKLEGVKLILGADGAVDAFMTFPLTDCFLLLALLLVALSFVEERKAGLWSVVHASPDGRLKLAVRRTLILFGASACGVVLLYGTNLILGFSIYGGIDDLDRTVQSVETLGRLPMLVTVSEFLLRFFLLRIAAAFLIALLLWLLLTAISNAKYTIIVAAAVLAAEYSLYTFLPVQSAFNILKYFNIFTYISLSDLYTDYLNIDVFTWPLGIRSISQFALVPLCLIAATASICVHCHKKPAAGCGILDRVAYGINSVTDRGLRCLRLLGMELHKTLWIQKGVVILVLLVYVASGLRCTASIPVTSLSDQAARQYMAQFAGPVTDDTFERMDAEQRTLDAAVTAHEDARAAFEDDLIGYPELDKYAREASAAQTKSVGLSTVRARAEELKSLGEQEGFSPWLIDDTPFESVYGLRAQANQHKTALVAVLALTLLLAGSMAYERQSGITFLLKSTARGRCALLFQKIQLSALMTTAVWGIVYGKEIYKLFAAFDITAWDVPARNLPMLTAFPLNCSITGCLVLLYACRWFCMFCAAVIVLLVSSLFRRMEAACIATAGVMLLPSLLYAYMGVEAFRPLAVILPVEVMPLLNEQNGAVSGAILWDMALMGTAAIIIVWLSVSAGGRKRMKV